MPYPALRWAAITGFLLLYIFTDFYKDHGFRDLSVWTGSASFRCEEKAGRAQQGDCTEQQSVGQTGVQQDPG